MWMDKKNNDLYDAIKETFKKFGISAIRADEIEHEGKITERILNEIEYSEFIFADLTKARPNVYYEIGYAHAIGKRPIMYRSKGTAMHFDIAVYNCPEYEDLRELKKLLTKRLAAITGRKPKES